MDGSDAAWTIVNTSAQPIVATLGLEMSAFHRARRMELLLDGRPVENVVVEPARRIYQIGPLTVIPGDHELVFHPAEAPTVAGDVINNGDRRPLSFALGTWSWTGRVSSRDAAVRLPGFLGRRRRALSRSRGGRLHALLLGQ